MSEAPVSERRLIEILNATIIPKFNELKNDISLLQTQVGQLKAFRDHEFDVATTGSCVARE
jgi:hypothetical protein